MQKPPVFFLCLSFVFRSGKQASAWTSANRWNVIFNIHYRKKRKTKGVSACRNGFSGNCFCSLRPYCPGSGGVLLFLFHWISKREGFPFRMYAAPFRLSSHTAPRCVAIWQWSVVIYQERMHLPLLSGHQCLAVRFLSTQVEIQAIFDFLQSVSVAFRGWHFRNTKSVN